MAETPSERKLICEQEDQGVQSAATQSGKHCSYVYFTTAVYDRTRHTHEHG